MKSTLVISLLCLLTNTVSAKTLSIGIDLSGSNPLLSHEIFAYAAADYLSSEVLKLETGDTVNIKTFGARENAVNVVMSSFTISRRVSANQIAESLTQFIRSIPEQNGISQASTNLIAYLEFTSGFQCESGGQVLVITDGLESSSLIGGNDLLSGKKGLPEPQIDLSGCDITFFGLGAGWEPQSIRIVRGAWQKWADQAGANFSAVIP